ncbi:MAG: carbohydrate ABC transporter permease [Ignavibacteriales bacterium]|nr:carbohydrate ABC transporter permease [Ignavibacteriales bacterium]
MKKFLIISLAVIVAVMTFTPFLWMLSASFMKSGAANTYPPKIFPDEFDFSHYKTLFTRLNLTRYLINSTVISLGVTALSLLFNSMAGYAFAKFRFKKKKSFFKFLLSAMIIPGQVTMLPVFLILKNMGLINTYWAIIVPAMASIFGIFLIRQYAFSIPDSLIEAAKMDSATELQIYFRIILPLCKPILVTLGLFTFMGTWNDFLWPLIVMTDMNMYTLPVALANLMSEHVQDTELMMAGSVITILPVLVVFLALQKYYIKGIMMGSVKE